jgi:hypothetical protein
MAATGIQRAGVVARGTTVVGTPSAALPAREVSVLVTAGI